MRPICVYVYIAGPLSGQMADNCRKAVLAGEELLQWGYTPFIPHLTMFWEAITGFREWEDWLDYDENWLRRCNVVLRLPGELAGADREVEYARQCGIPVVYSIAELIARFPV